MVKSIAIFNLDFQFWCIIRLSIILEINMFKRVVSIIAILLIGYLVGQELFIAFNAVMLLLSTFNIFSLEILYSQIWFNPVYILIASLLLIICIFAAFRAKKSQNVLYQIFTPTWQKLLVNALFFIFFLAIAFYIGKGNLISLNFQNFTVYSFGSNPTNMLLSLTASFLYLYPFSAIVYSLRQSLIKHKNKKLVNNKVLFIILLIFINPVVFYFGYLTKSWYFYNEDIKSNKLDKCGVRIVSVNKGGPAEITNLRSYDIIYKIDGVRVRTPDDLLNYLNNLSEQKPLSLETQLNTYVVTPKKDQVTEKFRLGISIDQGYCEK